MTAPTPDPLGETTLAVLGRDRAATGTHDQPYGDHAAIVAEVARPRPDLDGHDDDGPPGDHASILAAIGVGERA